MLSLGRVDRRGSAFKGHTLPFEINFMSYGKSNGYYIARKELKLPSVLGGLLGVGAAVLVV